MTKRNFRPRPHTATPEYPTQAQVNRRDFVLGLGTVAAGLTSLPLMTGLWSSRPNEQEDKEKKEPAKKKPAKKKRPKKKRPPQPVPGGMPHPRAPVDPAPPPKK